MSDEYKAYYIYALKDPRATPAKIFYIGKGTGNRAYDHVINVDKTRKGQFIQAIHDEGQKVVVTILVEDLNELQALKMESEMIAAFGTIDESGLLLNSVVPSGLKKNAGSSVIVPVGGVEKSQIGLKLLKDAIVELAKANKNGVTNSDVAKSLGLQSNFQGGAKDYLSYSLIGLLMAEGKLYREESGKTYKTTLS